MPLIKKSLLRKLFLYLLVLALLMAVLIFYFYRTEQVMVDIKVLAIALAVFLILFLLVTWNSILRPLNAVLKQMQAMLTGRRYKKVYTSRVDEIGILSHFFNEVTRSLKRVSVSIEERKRMASELEIASQLQRDILPKESPKIPGLDIVAKTRPAVELGGDSFDFLTVADKTYMYIGDVTGHGVPAGLVMTMVNTLVYTFAEIYDNAYDIVVHINKQLKPRIKATMSMTMVMMCWDSKKQKMTYVGAGHEHILIYRAATGECEVLSTGGIALGMIPDNSKVTKERELPLEEGDVIVLYSDGIVEGKNMAGEMYGLDRLKTAVKRYSPQYSAEGINYHIASDFSRFVGEHIQEDDITLIAMKYIGLKGETEEKKSKDLTTEWSEGKSEVTK